MSNATLKSIKSWFDNHYMRKGFRSMRAFNAYPLFLEYLNAGKGDKLLDVGCGPGFLLKAAEKRGIESYGFDISKEAVKLAGKSSPSSTVLVGEASGIIFDDGFFDYITCIGVLEHFLDVRKAIEEIQRVAKNDAKFCIMVPNSSTLYWKLSQIFSRNHRASNENALSLSQWQSLFRSNGFDILEVYRDDWQIRKGFSLLFLSRFETLFMLFRRLIRSIIPIRFAHQFIFIMRKVEGRMTI